MKFNDNYFMKKALKIANDAIINGEVPVGAIIVLNEKIIARAHNQTENLNDVTAHAEMLSITSASNFLNSKFLKGCTMYVTLEPCIMCCGALYLSQIDRLVYAASDDKGGITRGIKLHPKTKITSGIMKMESERIIKNFFNQLRLKKIKKTNVEN
jgi:tRNA(adenine34) deaminase